MGYKASHGYTTGHTTNRFSILYEHSNISARPHRSKTVLLKYINLSAHKNAKSADESSDHFCTKVELNDRDFGVLAALVYARRGDGVTPEHTGCAGL